ncbi:MAG: CBS domain-containing protein [Phycisphaerales bacterium]|nr:CBS domain-containing protein [Phycisphaerales bacterium]
MHLVIRKPIEPLIGFMGVWIVSPLSRLLAPPRAHHQMQGVSAEQMGTLINLSANDGVIDLGEQELLTSIVSMGHMRVEQVMTPRVDMSWIDLETSNQEIIEICRTTKRTRLAVCIDGIDGGVSGIVSARRILEGEKIETAMADVLFVPEQGRLDSLIDQFRTTGQSIAVCVDEHGGVSGIVTLADVTAELIEGVDNPERDLANKVEMIGIGKWIVPGRLSIRDWAVMFADQSVIEHAKRVNTIGGLIMVLLDRVPEVGDQARIGGIQLSVVEMNKRSIERVEVEILPADQGGAS